MSETRPSPYRTHALWLILAVLLLFGTVGGAFVVYGVTGLATGAPWWLAVPTMGIGGFVAFVCFLLLVGILYRVDRIRGTVHRRIELFE